jgi:hypothetical protein
MSADSRNVVDPTPDVQPTTVNEVTFTKGHEPTLLHMDEPLGTLITVEEWWAMTADELRQAIARDMRDMFRYPDGTYGLWDLECDEYEIVPQNAHDSPSALRTRVPVAAPASGAPELQGGAR